MPSGSGRALLNWLRAADKFDLGVLGVVAAAAAGTLTEAYLRDETRDAQTPSQCRYAPCAAVLTEDAVRTLQRDGLVQLDNVLDAAVLGRIRTALTARQQRGGFEAAVVGDAGSTTARSDVVQWIRGSDADLDEDLAHALCLVRGMADELVEVYGYGPVALHVPRQAQLACYAPGPGGYVPHRDSADESLWDTGLLGWLRSAAYRKRALTCILYLNAPDWGGVGEQHGGQLRAYLGAAPGDPNGTTATSVRDIDPQGGRLLLFDSKVLLHEVLPSRRERFALTVWLAGGDLAAAAVAAC